MFDTTMGTYAGAECCELIGLLMVFKMKTRFLNLNIGIYRDVTTVWGPIAEVLARS